MEGERRSDESTTARNMGEEAGAWETGHMMAEEEIDSVDNGRLSSVSAQPGRIQDKSVSNRDHPTTYEYRHSDSPGEHFEQINLNTSQEKEPGCMRAAKGSPTASVPMAAHETTQSPGIRSMVKDESSSSISNSSLSNTFGRRSKARGTPNSNRNSTVSNSTNNTWLSKTTNSISNMANPRGKASRSRSTSLSHRPQTATSSHIPPSPSIQEDRVRSATLHRGPSKSALLDRDATATWLEQNDKVGIGMVPSTSRKSVYSAFSPDTHSVDTESREEVLSTPSSPGKEKRRLFSRSRASLSNVENAGSSQHSPLMRIPSSTGIIRRVSSRSFFSRDKDSNDAMRSSESLASSSTSTKQDLGRRAANMLSKTTALPAWAKRRREGVEAQVEAPVEAVSADHIEGDANARPSKREGRTSMDSYASINSVSELGGPDESRFTGQEVMTGLGIAASGEAGVDSEGLKAGDPEEGIPKRLSGWLLTMLSNEQTANPPSPTVDGVKMMTPSRNEAMHRLQNPQESSSTQKGQPSASVLQSSRAKGSGGLLASLSSSGRARSESPASTNTGASRSGLDRALRYFLSPSEQDDDGGGTWLLGVWHGPKENVSDAISQEGRRKGPKIEIVKASPQAQSRGTPTTESSTARTTGSESSSSPLRRALELEGDEESSLSSARRTRETSPSVASASTNGSIGRKNKFNGYGDRPSTPEGESIPTHSGGLDDHVVARNPPTPQTSPILSGRKGERIPLSIATAPPSLSSASAALQDKTSPYSTKQPSEASFQLDFSSRVWCTYRSHFVPISRDGVISTEAEAAAAENAAIMAESQNMPPNVSRLSDPSPAVSTPTVPTPGKGWLGRRFGESNTSTDLLSGSPSSAVAAPSPGGLGAALGIQNTGNVPHPASNAGGGLGEKMGIPNLWGRATAAAQAVGLGGKGGLTTDAGWGCMLRTGQSVLANALINAHLGRDWRRAKEPVAKHCAPRADDDESLHQAWRKSRSDYAKYVEILSWFMDEPSLACPFGVHRMAREGKRLGKEVGEWFGPSTAAGAIKKLVDEFPGAGVGVSLASDGVVYLDHARQAAQEPGSRKGSSWSRPVLILIGIRLGLDGVHPTYYDSVKDAFSFPQSVGIAGGRPSSSYYFVGFQGASLFYLDPHHVRACVPFRHPPPQLKAEGLSKEELQDFSDEWWSHTYHEQELATFHCDRPRRMPMKSLDPSMLLGFLCMDEGSLDDFTHRVKSMPKAIFSILDSPPKWMDEGSDDEGDNHALESFSEGSIDEEIGTEEEEGHAGHTDMSSASKLTRKNGQRMGSDENLASSTMTTTPRTENTFEFVDGRSPTRRHDVRLVSNASTRTAIPVPIPDQRNQQVADESLSGAYSVVSDSDTGSAWEEVGEDRGAPSSPDSSGRSRTQAIFGGQAPSSASLLQRPLTQPVQSPL